MWELTIRLVSPNGAPLAGHKVTAAFQLRLAGAGADLLMPAEATGLSDPAGCARLSLPSPATLGDTLRIVVRDADGRVVHEVDRPTAGLGNETELLVGQPSAPAALVVELKRGAAALPGTDVVVLGRPEGGASFTVVLAGRTDEAGRLSGPFPGGRYAEASAIVRLDGNQTLTVALSEGRFPARLPLALEAVGAPSVEVLPVATPAAAPVVAPGPVVTSTALAPVITSYESVDDEESGDEQRRRRRARRSVEVPGASERLTLALLAVVLLVGAVLRFYELGGPSLWNDELSSWRRSAYDTVAKVISKGSVEDVHPPGYYLLLHVVQRVGDSEWLLRLPSALAGVGALVVIFLLGRRLWSEREGLVAAALMAVMWAPIRYSQEARSYSLLILASMLSFWTWMDLLREAERKGRLELYGALWYVLASTALIYLHYFGVLVLALQALAAFLYVLAKQRRQGALMPLAGVYGVIGLLYLPWLGPFWDDLSKGNSWIEAPEEGGGFVFWTYLEFVFNHQTVLAVLMTAIVGGAAGWQLMAARAGKKIQFSVRSRWGLVTFWLLGPFLVAWLQSVLSTPVLSNRNLLVSAPAAYLIVARAITALPVPARLQAAIAILAVGASLLGFNAKGYYSKPHRQQFREAVSYVVEHEKKAPKPAIIVTGHPAHFNYYFEKLGAKHSADISASSEDELSKVERLLTEQQPKSIWRLTAGKNRKGPVEAFLGERFKLVDEAEFFGTTVALYKRGKDGEDQSAAKEEPAPEDAGAPSEESKPNKKAKKGKKAQDAEEATKAARSDSG